MSELIPNGVSPTIDRRREARRLFDLRIKQLGIETYNSFDKNERGLVRFGMFPMGKMEQAQAVLLAELQSDDGWSGYEQRDISRLLSVAIMDAANAGPDKMLV